MIGRKSLSIIPIAATLLGCAEPKYFVEQPTHSGSAVQTQKVADCEVRFQKSGYCLLWQWEKKPTSSQTGSLTFKVMRGNALDDSPAPVDFQAVPALVLWMPSMGHGSVPTFVEQIDVGTYRATNVFFNMPGDWELKFQIKDGDTVVDEAVVPLII